MYKHNTLDQRCSGLQSLSLSIGLVIFFTHMLSTDQYVAAIRLYFVPTCPKLPSKFQYGTTRSFSGTNICYIL